MLDIVNVYELDNSQLVNSLTLKIGAKQKNGISLEMEVIYAYQTINMKLGTIDSSRKLLVHSI